MACKLVSVVFFDMEAFRKFSVGESRSVTCFAGAKVVSFLGEKKNKSSCEAKFVSLDGTIIKVSGNFEEKIAEVINLGKDGDSATVRLNVWDIRVYEGKTYANLWNGEFKKTTASEHKALNAVQKIEKTDRESVKIVFDTKLP
jgi:hypothetical protein